MKKAIILLFFLTASQFIFAQIDTTVKFIQSEQYKKFFGADYPYLKQAEKKYVEGNISMNQSLRIISEADQYRLEAESVIDPKRKKDLEGKAVVKEEEGQGLQLDAYVQFAFANSEKMKIYDKFFRHTWPNATPDLIISREKARIMSNGNFERATNFRKVSEKLAFNNKLDNFYKADSLELGALKLMEDFLESYMNQQVKQKDVPNFRDTPEFTELFKAESNTLRQMSKLEFEGDSLIALGSVELIKAIDNKAFAETLKRKRKYF